MKNQFKGSNYIEQRDHDRLSDQKTKIFNLMEDGIFRTLDQISSQIKEPPASISAQLRHLRKPSFGSHIVNKKYRGDGLFSYQLIVNKQKTLLDILDLTNEPNIINDNFSNPCI